jgi:hypothetical protein
MIEWDLTKFRLESFGIVISSGWASQSHIYNSFMGSDGLAKLTELLHQVRETLQQALKRASEGRHGLKTGTQRA